jgi:predicted nucleic acid-binding protein
MRLLVFHGSGAKRTPVIPSADTRLDRRAIQDRVVAEHVHHDAATEWLSESNAGFATCPITQGSRVRFSSERGNRRRLHEMSFLEQ